MQENEPQFFYPKSEIEPRKAERAIKPGGFPIPLNYFAFILTEAKVKIGPHWHPNADELAYFISGEGTVGITEPGGKISQFNVSAGDIFIFPEGYPHFFINRNGPEDPLRFLAFFNNPEFSLIDSSSVPAVPGTEG